jgi:ankyrin repeat protein
LAQDELSETIWEGNDADVIAMIEKNPVLISGCDCKGYAPLHIAAATLNEGLTRWLLDHGADVNRPGPGD